MAIRRLNYTGRKRIRREDVRITLYELDGSSMRFDAKLNLQPYRLPEDALVFVEAYRQTTWMRFSFGTVGKTRAEDAPVLTEFDTPEGVLFRVRVTAVHEPRGKLLAEADSIQPRKLDDEEQRRIALLPVKPDPDLGDEVWRVDFSDPPILLLNSDLADFAAVLRSPAFVSLVYPAVLREILLRVLYGEHPREVEEDDDWRAQWLRFAVSLPGMSMEVPANEADPDKKDRFIDEAVRAFCRQHKLMKRFSAYWTGEGSS